MQSWRSDERYSHISNTLADDPFSVDGEQVSSYTVGALPCSAQCGMDWFTLGLRGLQ